MATAVFSIFSAESLRRLSLEITSSFLFNDATTPEIYTLSLHDALPISSRFSTRRRSAGGLPAPRSCQFAPIERSEEHTSELQSLRHLVCRLLLEKKKKKIKTHKHTQKTQNNKKKN